MASPRRLPSPSAPAPAAKRHRLVQITDFTCALCNVHCNDSLSLARHVSSAQHRHRLLRGDARDVASAAPPPAPAVRFDPATAFDQLLFVVQTMFSSFALLTVHVMFHSRTRRLARTITSEAVRSSPTIGHYSALILSAPITIKRLAQAARDCLACADQASITLTDEQRQLLQIDCLYRRFLNTEIGYHFPLCYETAYVCAVRNLAPVLLPQTRAQPLLIGIAAAIVATVVVRTSSYH